jgi:hypothetical protein
MLASLSTFGEMVMTKADYEENLEGRGPLILKKAF